MSDLRPDFIFNVNPELWDRLVIGATKLGVRIGGWYDDAAPQLVSKNIICLNDRELTRARAKLGNTKHDFWLAGHFLLWAEHTEWYTLYQSELALIRAK